MTLAELQSRIDSLPLHRAQPLRALACNAQSVSLALPWREEYGNGRGVMHGGVLATLIDTAAAMALVAARGDAGPSLNLRVDFLKAVRPGEEIVASTSLRRAGRTLAFIDVEVRNPQGALVALGRANYLASPAS